ncbi:hypothetical protein ABT072_34030 [Streptomyces sp. NPDC002589]|uniref:hypothetical protein n=1 Tax=Streptomyces sp. NPDC002589 TaxID=3154420 RepID=UPI003323863D
MGVAAATLGATGLGIVATTAQAAERHGSPTAGAAPVGNSVSGDPVDGHQLMGGGGSRALGKLISAAGKLIGQGADEFAQWVGLAPTPVQASKSKVAVDVTNIAAKKVAKTADKANQSAPNSADDGSSQGTDGAPPQESGSGSPQEAGESAPAPQPAQDAAAPQ